GRWRRGSRSVAAAAKEASAAGAPPSMFDAYRIVQQEVDTIVATKFPKTLAHSGEDSRVQIELNRLQHAHELAIEELKGEREQANNQFQVTMLELKDRMERQWAEYKDNKATREDALGGLQDILGSLAAGVKVGGGGGGEAGIQAEVAGFKCQNCGSEVVVPDGASEVVCPDEKCGYQYKIHRK
ncbi:MAG: hypothetical protein Q8N51_03980, partial [Gammaproteobacteria bacterium]|nr:hypothetical protein [Gammaproteobacteria bacterium]